MNIQTEKRGEVIVIRPVGRIDSANANDFERAVKTQLEAGARSVILDFSQLDYISSAGLRCVLIAGKQVRALPGGKLVLAGLRDPVREIFEISGFLSIFAVADSVEAAASHFA